MPNLERPAPQHNEPDRIIGTVREERAARTSPSRCAPTRAIASSTCA